MRLKCFAVFILVLITGLYADLPRTMYVLNGSAETVSTMNLDNSNVRQNLFKTGLIPNQILAHQDKIYVLDSGTSDIKIFDPIDGFIRTIALNPGANPYDMVFVSANKAYVSNWVANTISVVELDDGFIIRDIKVGDGPEGLLLVDNKAFVANTGYAGWGMPYNQGSICIIDILADSVISTLMVPTNPQVLALAPDGKIHVLCTGDYAEIDGKIAVVDLYTGPDYNNPAVIDTIDIGGSPGDLEITPSGKAYCVDWGDGINGFLYVYDTTTGDVYNNVEHPILVGPNAGQVLYDGRENCLWIPSMTMWGGDGCVQKFDIDQNSVVWKSKVLGNGSQKVVILEKIWQPTPWADAIASFWEGEGSGFGSNYYPINVIGPPDQDPSLSKYNASNKPQEILSLGFNGEITLEFVDNYIIDGQGADFTVFENVFISLFDGFPFIEAGIVSVSQNGQDFVEFPYDTASWKGLAGITPTYDNLDFCNPEISGGDQFDLADLGLPWVRFVRIKDLGDIKKEGLWNGDFDLDAVVAINYRAGEPTDVKKKESSPETIDLLTNYPNPFNPKTTLCYKLTEPQHILLTIYNTSGQLIKTIVNDQLDAGKYATIWDGIDNSGKAVSSGLYIAQIKTNEFTKSIKMTLLH